MKKFFVVLLLLGIVGTFFNKQQTIAQNVNDGVYLKENIPGKRPVPYPPLREADILWTKKIWQIIDCREKMNHPFYYPIVDMDDRKSLISLLIYGINNEGLMTMNLSNWLQEMKFIKCSMRYRIHSLSQILIREN